MIAVLEMSSLTCGLYIQNDVTTGIQENKSTKTNLLSAFTYKTINIKGICLHTLSWETLLSTVTFNTFKSLRKIPIRIKCQRGRKSL